MNGSMEPPNTVKIVNVGNLVKPSKPAKLSKPAKPSKSDADEKPDKMRYVTHLKRWNFDDADYTVENQCTMIAEIARKNGTNEPFTKKEQTVVSEISHKIYGYKHQDIKKCIFQPDEFIDLSTILAAMNDCGLHCFYCKTGVQVLYPLVREPKQWTVERIDNSIGHNRTNIVIACLDCNLHRRTMYYERYVFTKQLNIVKHA